MKNQDKTDWFMIGWVLVFGALFIYSLLKWWYCW